ncbi:hypothetical protein AJ78_05638 [Emergomyces pasteurianus Ep9510]|uniref:Uncharacterized protein n=1 Tax=Emergomyces pasteurianus Ep9510 TaxID=1447872 RepID=A0A1J9PD97_9EURO|nr:hypothetical protein AJ78_05638 [Emergomyces pasteurianus Ep9510]
MESVILPSSSTLHKRATVEYLPAEIKIEILCQLADLLTLRNFVKASPDFHRVYRFDRRRILGRLLARTTPLPFLVEVASLPALRRAAHYDPLKGEEWSLRFTKGFLNIYNELRCFSRISDHDGHDPKRVVDTNSVVNENERVETRSINGVNFTYSKDIGISAQLDSLSLDELLLVVRLHFIVHSISEDFALSCLRLNPFTAKRYHGRLADNGCGNGGGSVDRILPLSDTETYRIHRALYRLEMLALIYKLWRVRDPNFYITFLQSLPPWEMEEIHCVRNYMYQIYLIGSFEVSDSSNCSVVDGRGRAMDHALSNEARRGRRGRVGGTGIRIGGTDSDGCVDFDLAVDNQREQYLTLGLEFLWQWIHEFDQDESCRVIKTNPDVNVNKTLVSLDPKICVTGSDSTGVSFFLTRALNPSVVGFFRPMANSPQSFTSDANWPGPNLGWEWLHHMNSKYLCQMHNCYNRKWGYVFWDKKRLTGMGLREEMRREYAPFVD